MRNGLQTVLIEYDKAGGENQKSHRGTAAKSQVEDILVRERVEQTRSPLHKQSTRNRNSTKPGEGTRRC